MCIRGRRISGGCERVQDRAERDDDDDDDDDDDGDDDDDDEANESRNAAAPHRARSRQGCI